MRHRVRENPLDHKKGFHMSDNEHQKYAHQKRLRAAAQAALEQQGHKVVPVKGTGGAQVDLEHDGKRSWAFVRTSADRWIGWMRDGSTGDFKGFDEDASLVVIASLDSKTKPTRIEIYAFNPTDVQAAFRANLVARKASNPDLAHKAPIFVCLDRMERGVPADTSSGLKEKALWSTSLPFSGVAAEGSTVKAEPNLTEAPAEKSGANVQPPRYETTEGFAARVRQEFADLVGVPVEKVRVEFHVTI